MFGAYGSFPRRLGGGPDELATIHADLLESYGTAFDKSRGGRLWDICYADARALWAGWQANKRLQNQANPALATWSLPKWEAELGLSAYGLTGPQRRRQLAAHVARWGKDTSWQDIHNVLLDTLGDMFVETRVHTPDEAMVHAAADQPWGTVDPDAPWYSTVSYLNVVVREVSGVGEGEFYERIGRMQNALHGRLNVWVTFDWTMGDGFLLDTPDQLDIVSFDE